jgi:hypothetical protein
MLLTGIGQVMAQGIGFSSRLYTEPITRDGFQQLTEYSSAFDGQLRNASRGTDILFADSEGALSLLTTRVEIVIIESSVIQTPAVMQKLDIRVDLTTTIAGGSTVLSSSSIELSGLGRNINAAFTSGLRSVNRTLLNRYLREAGTGATSYLTANCDRIIGNARNVAKTDPDVAINALSMIPPTIDSCFPQAQVEIMEILAGKDELQCKQLMTRVNAGVARSNTKENYESVLNEIRHTKVSMACMEEVTAVIENLQEKITTISSDEAQERKEQIEELRLVQYRQFQVDSLKALSDERVVWAVKTQKPESADKDTGGTNVAAAIALSYIISSGDYTPEQVSAFASIFN